MTTPEEFPVPDGFRATTWDAVKPGDLVFLRSVAERDGKLVPAAAGDFEVVERHKLRRLDTGVEMQVHGERLLLWDDTPRPAKKAARRKYGRDWALDLALAGLSRAVDALGRLGRWLSAGRRA